MVRKRPPPSVRTTLKRSHAAAARSRQQHELLAATRHRAAEQPAVEVDRLPLLGAARMDGQVQARPDPQPHARRRGRDRVVDVAAVAEGHVARRRPLGQRDAPSPSAPVVGPARLASSRALTAVVLETMSIAALAIGAPSAVEPPTDEMPAPEPADQQRPAPAGPNAPSAARDRSPRRHSPHLAAPDPTRPDRLARGDRPRDRPEDRRPISRGVLEQHAHDVLALRQLGRVDVESAVVDA